MVTTRAQATTARARARTAARTQTSKQIRYLNYRTVGAPGFAEYAGAPRVLSTPAEFQLPDGECPEGQEMGYRGRCVKACEEGKVRDPRTNRCVTSSFKKTLRPAEGIPFVPKSQGGHYVRKFAPKFKFMKSVHGFDTARNPMVRYVTPAYRQACPKGMYLDPRTMNCKRGLAVPLRKKRKNGKTAMGYFAPPAGRGRYREVYDFYRSRGYKNKKVLNRRYYGYDRDGLTKYKARVTKRAGSRVVVPAKYRIVPRHRAANAKKMNAMLAQKSTASRLEVHRRRQRVRLMGHAWRMALDIARRNHKNLAKNRDQRMVVRNGKKYDPNPDAYRKLMQKAKTMYFPPLKDIVEDAVNGITSLSQKPPLSILNVESQAMMPPPPGRPVRTTRATSNGAGRRRSMRLRNLRPQSVTQ